MDKYRRFRRGANERSIKNKQNIQGDMILANALHHHREIRLTVFPKIASEQIGLKIRQRLSVGAVRAGILYIVTTIAILLSRNRILRIATEPRIK